jgi:carbon-monoxide dehydrogenase medium subunit
VEEVARRSGDFALAGVVCALGLDESDDAINRAGMALFGVGATPVRAKAAEEALVSGASIEDVVAAALDGLDPVADLHAPGEYRRQVAGVLVVRAVQKAIEEARRA